MKSLVIYYSYSGSTKKAALKKAEELGADILELQDIKRPSKFSLFLAGAYAAMRCKEAKLKPFHTDFSSYDNITIAMPIWAGSPAPAINNIINILPPDKEVQLIFVSGSGSSGKSEDKFSALIGQRGSNVTGVQNLTTAQASELS